MKNMINEFKSEMELRESFKCETLKDGNGQMLIVHQGPKKLSIPFGYYIDELNLNKAKEISEVEYLNLLSENHMNNRNNYYFSK